MKAAIQMIREADRGQLLIDAQAGIDQIVAAIEDAHGQGKGRIVLTFEITSEVPGAFTIASKLDVAAVDFDNNGTLVAGEWRTAS